MRAQTMIWAGGEDDFRLPIENLLALQDRCGGDGVGLIYQRIASQVFGVRDILDTLTLGLMGGGMSRQDANAKVRSMIEAHGLLELAPTAQAVLGLALMPAAMDGDDDLDDDGDASGEATAGAETNP